MQISWQLNLRLVIERYDHVAGARHRKEHFLFMLFETLFLGTLKRGSGSFRDKSDQFNLLN